MSLDFGAHLQQRTWTKAWRTAAFAGLTEQLVKKAWHAYVGANKALAIAEAIG